MVTDEDNATIERMISEGKSPMAIRAAVPNVSRTNVYLKINKFKKHGTVGRVQTKTLGRPRAMTDGVDKFLQGLLAAKPDMELDEMRRHLQTELQLTVSMSTISRAISRHGIHHAQRPVRTKRRKNKVPALSDHLVRPLSDDLIRPLSDLPPAPAPAPAPAPSTDPLIHTHPPDHHMPPAHLLHHWPDMSHPQHLNHHHHHLHALDPSLASVYHPSAVYPDVYPDPHHHHHHHHLQMPPASALDAYRSPYAPM